MKIVVKALVCAVVLSLVGLPASAKGGRGGGKGGGSVKSYSYTIKPSPSSTTTKEQTKRPKINYRFGGSNDNNQICRHNGGISHCNAQGKYVCQDGTISSTNKVCQ